MNSESTKFINDIFLAGKIYFESKNIASFKLEDFFKVIKYVYEKGQVEKREALNALSLMGINKRDISGYLSLGWHTGLFYTYHIAGKEFYGITRLTRDVIKESLGGSSRRCLEILRNILGMWEPLKTLLRFFKHRGKIDYKEAINVLGSDMRFWNEKLYRLGLPVKLAPRGNVPAKPFNSYVVMRLFKPMLEELQLHDLNIPESTYVFARSRVGEPIVATGIAQIIYSGDEAFLVTYVIDKYGIDFILKASTLNTRNRKCHITIITRKPAIKDYTEIKNKVNMSGIELKILRTKLLHAKIYTSNTKTFLSSANLIRTSLLRNIEFGLMLYRKAPDIDIVINELLCKARRIF